MNFNSLKNSKSFRLFVSSTFDDFRREREILQSKVFPIISNYCKEMGGNFQPIDLRWGISENAQFDQMTEELCLQEVRACKNYPHPNFLMLVGDRYGWIPLPFAIEAREFELLIDCITKEEKSTLLSWYQKDLNQIPASYLLKERTKIYKESDHWNKIESELRSILQAAVLKAEFSNESKNKYFTSATEREVEEGVFSYSSLTEHQQKLVRDKPTYQVEEKKYLFGFIRNISPRSAVGNKFINTDFDQAQVFKSKIRKVVLEENVITANTVQLNSDQLDEFYLENFEVQSIRFLKKMIEERLKAVPQLSLLEMELENQRNYALRKQQDFIGQKKCLEEIQKYIEGNNNEALVIHGISGSGKSAVMAKAVQLAEQRTKHKVYYRFVGASPASTNSVSLLTQLLEEMDIPLTTSTQREGKNEDNRSLETKADVEFFFEKVRHKLESSVKNVVLFIDAVDQFLNQDFLNWLPNKLQNNLKIIISVIEDENYPDDLIYFNILKNKTTNIFKLPSFEQPIILLKTVLAQQNRDIQPSQLLYFVKQFNKTPTPLYVIVAAQEMKHWSSKYSNFVMQLGDSQQSMIQKFIENLHQENHHSKELVNKVLGYFEASSYGLSEQEILQLLELDKSFLQKLVATKWHHPSEIHLPIVIWTRIFAELKPFLGIASVLNEELIFFQHREFNAEIRQMDNLKVEYEHLIAGTQIKLKQAVEEKLFYGRWDHIYALLIINYGVRFREYENLEEYGKFIAELGDDQWRDHFLNSLNNWGIEFLLTIKNEEFHSYNVFGYYINKYRRIGNDDLTAQNETVYLYNVADYYRQNNEMEKALDYSKKALNISEEGYKKDRETYSFVHTKNLSLYAFALKANNQLKLAIEVEEKNKMLQEGNFKKDPVRWSFEYAITLNNLAFSYKEIRQYEKALKLEHESVEITRQCYERNKLDSASGYRLSLNNLAWTYMNIYESEKAISLNEKAVEIIEQAYQLRPNHFFEDYKLSLSNLASAYSRSNKLELAFKLEEKAAELIYPYFLENPERWSHEYADSHKRLGIITRKQHRFDNSIELLIKAVRLHEQLYSKDQNAWADDYFKSLVELSTSYSNKGDKEAAIATSNKLLQIITPLLNEDYDRWISGYATACNDIAICHGNLGNYKTAIEYGLKHLAVWTELHKKKDNNTTAYLATSLANLGYYHEHNEEYNKAIEYLIQALKLRKDLSEKFPIRWSIPYVRALSSLAGNHAKNNDFPNADKYYKKALSIAESNYSTKPDIWALQYTLILHLYSYYLDKFDQLTKAILYEEKSLSIKKPLYNINPEKWVFPFLISIVSLAYQYEKAEKYEAAENLLNIAQPILKSLHKKHPNDCDDLLKSYNNTRQKLADKKKN